jgi:epoxyqueuosine reductase
MTASLNTAEAMLSARAKEHAQKLGFDLVGISPVKLPPHGESFAEWLRQKFHGELGYMERTAALRRDPRTLAPWALSVISLGMNYYTPHPRRDMRPAESHGWISRYAWGDDYHDLIHDRLDKLLAEIGNLCGRQVQGRGFVDSAPLLERDLAGVAGLGWIGKNTQLISPRRGSWFFLAELLVDVPLAYDEPMRDRCGRCDLCLKACPTQAFAGPYVLDARRCISYLTIELKGPIPRHLRRLIGDHVFGCDICQDVCPYNVKAKPTPEAAFQPRSGLHAPDLIDLLALSETEFRLRFKGSPIRRAKRRGFLRNVAVALGNLKCVDAVPALIQVLVDPEPLVRMHAAWALGEIPNDQAMMALKDRLPVEGDPAVVEEIRAALRTAS